MNSYTTVGRCYGYSGFGADAPAAPADAQQPSTVTESSQVPIEERTTRFLLGMLVGGVAAATAVYFAMRKSS